MWPRLSGLLLIMLNHECYAWTKTVTTLFLTLEFYSISSVDKSGQWVGTSSPEAVLMGSSPRAVCINKQTQGISAGVGDGAKIWHSQNRISQGALFPVFWAFPAFLLLLVDGFLTSLRGLGWLSVQCPRRGTDKLPPHKNACVIESHLWLFSWPFITFLLHPSSK